MTVNGTYKHRCLQFMNEKQITSISKFLSLILRHQPETIGLQLDQNGWADVKTIIEKANVHGVQIELDTLKQVVDTNSKKRFAFNETFDKIRASQGHSLDIELGYSNQKPPQTLYHGTGEKSIPSILENGLEKRKRQHVHLSIDVETAVKVGQRHGKPAVLEISAEVMYNDNFIFYRSDNGVWLTDNVPARYLKPIEKNIYKDR